MMCIFPKAMLWQKQATPTRWLATAIIHTTIRQPTTKRNHPTKFTRMKIPVTTTPEETNQQPNRILETMAHRM
jgi:hypothetical protein